MGMSLVDVNAAITVFTAKRFVTLHTGCPVATAVAVRGDRIVAIGTMDEVTQGLGGVAYVVDETFSDLVVLPGLIDQHLHPVLGASTLATEVIATEDWLLPDRTFPAANSHEEYVERLGAAHEAMEDDSEWLFSWGYHSLWHGELSRDVLDTISPTRPIGVWQRSCHEFYLNTAAMAALGIDAESIKGQGAGSDMIDLERGHFWEAGFMTVLMRKLSPVFLTPERLTRGLNQMVQYLHLNGVTAINEPGAILAPGAWDLYQTILGHEDTPFASSFVVDARGPAENGVPADEAIAQAEELIARAPNGKVSFFADQVKLFADGAIISQLMQMKDGYLDASGNPNPDHHGEWLMAPDVFEERAKAYWDAGYQLHIHVNGDLGLEMVLDTIERRMRENPRPNHRTVIVHFANSTEEQVDRIARLGAIVSSNPYYPCGFADKYGEYGLGPDRADVMTRNQSVLDRGVSLSFHSDLPMGPSDPLGMMSCAVNRITQSGRVAGPEQRIDAEAALRAVTIEAAYSWRKEDELGSISPGKIANFTVVNADPLEVDPATIGDIEVQGTVFEGRWFPVPEQARNRASAARGFAEVIGLATAKHGHDHRGCACDVARALTASVG